MLDRAYRLSSSWSYLTEECERLKSVFSKLKYPKHVVDSTVKTFLNLKVADQPSSRSRSTTENTTRVVIPFKAQESANIVKTQLKDLSVKLQTIVQPVFTSRKIAQEFPTNEPKPQLIDQHETTQKASTVSTPCNLLELSSSIPDIPQFKPH